VKETECPDLHPLSMLLQGANRVKDKMIADHRGGLALVKVETDVSEFRKQIGHHRASCPQCNLMAHSKI
jgi:hypothetical protein